MKMQISLFLPTLVLFLILCVTFGRANKPNILVIVADDMGYSDLGCYGGEIKSPHLDGLAKQGLRFTNFYVNNMCWPTRASLLSGLYPETVLTRKKPGGRGLRRETTLLPEALKSEGYATFMSGKWHLSNSEKPNGPSTPHNRGFDSFYGTIEGASDFFAPAGLQLNGEDLTHEWKGDRDYYYTDAITDYALKFLKEREQPESNPFFLYVAYTAAHWPLHAMPDDIAHYMGHYEMGWDKLRRQRHERMKNLGVVDPSLPLSPRHSNIPAWEHVDNKAWQQRRMEVYAAQVTSMDRNIGRLIQYLKSTGQFENTLILYFQDNGACHVEYHPKRTGSWTRETTTDGKDREIIPGNIPGIMPGPQTTFQSYGYGWANASNTPFRLFKKFDHEGGVRSPLIVSWPDGIDLKNEGDITNEVSHVIDLMPTLLDAAGVKEFKQRPFAFEGHSLLSVIKQEPGNHGEPRSPLFWGHANGNGVRLGKWKLVSAKKGDWKRKLDATIEGSWELYNLNRDGTEMYDLSDKMPEVVREMAAMHAAWEKRTHLRRTSR